jgi:hypothetical protein
MSNFLEFKQSKSTSWESKSSKHEVEMASDLDLDADADADLENSWNVQGMITVFCIEYSFTFQFPNNFLRKTMKLAAAMDNSTVSSRDN